MKLLFSRSSVLLLLMSVVSYTSCIEKNDTKPNILWINCDDLGRELTCYGNPDVFTPNMDRLAMEGVRFLNAYSNTPVCSSSRSSQITGMYPTAINCLNHRTMEKKKLPAGIVPVMELFREAGYFCTNGSAVNMQNKGKEDYNFVGQDFFDGTDWNQREEDQPFFAQVQIHEPHRVFVKDPETPVDPAKVKLPKCYPDHPLIRADWALYLESVQTADKRVGLILERLEQEGMLENTAIFLFGDHGRPHLRDKQWLYEGGLAIPLIVRYPEKFKAGAEREDLISLIDVTASSLALAGIDIPEYMHGLDVLGGENRAFAFGFRQRSGDAVDDIRSITDGQYKLIWNRMPELPYMQLTSYKKLQYPAFTLYRVLHEKGELEDPYKQFMVDSRPEFELYRLASDPEEQVNLAGDEAHEEVEAKLFAELQRVLSDVEKDMLPESEEAMEKGIQGSRTFYAKGIQRKGLKADASDEEILEMWEKQLLK